MSLAFILGREPHLSVAELFAVLGDAVRWEEVEVSKEVMVIPMHDVGAAPRLPRAKSKGGRPREREAVPPMDPHPQTRAGTLPRPYADALMSRLAGTVKIADVLDVVPSASLSSPRPSVAEGEGGFSSLTDAIGQFILDHTDAGRRVRYGFSVYDLGGGAKEVARVRKELQRSAKDLKAQLEAQGRKVRHVTSRDATLSSVTVERQGLLPEDNGVEVCVLVGRTSPSPAIAPPPPSRGVAKQLPGRVPILQQPSEGEVVIRLARTLAVQPYQEWSARDYGRPRRDARSGMLPPKLARAMCNIALARMTNDQAPMTKQISNSNSQIVQQTDDVQVDAMVSLEIGNWGLGIQRVSLLDPFCGSGTVLTEAMLVGVPHIIGTDVSDTAVRDAQENVEWVQRASRKSQISNLKSQIFQCDVRHLSRCVREKVDVIVTEPYLGPPLPPVVGAGLGFGGFADSTSPLPSRLSKRQAVVVSRGLDSLPPDGRPRGVAPTRNDAAAIVNDLGALYLAAFREFSNVLAPNGRVVFIVPDFRSPHHHAQPPSNLSIERLYDDVGRFGFRRVNPFPAALRDHPVLRGRDDLPYARADQRVGRRVLIFEFGG